MIADNTVLILGAGASMPYGFPSGNALTEQIITFMRTTNPKFHELCDSQDLDIKLATRAGESFQATRLYSIDRYLRIIKDRPKYVRIFKSVMAYILFQHEDANPGVSAIGDDLDSSPSIYRPGYYDGPTDDWYRYLWDRLQEPSVEEFEQNQLTVLTFNYDRSLTEYLVERIQWTYSLGIYDAMQSFKKAVNIIHVHGSIGLHPFDIDFGEERRAVVEYGEMPAPGKFSAAVDQIKTVHEELVTHDMRNTIARVIRAADRVVFLGLSYQPENLERLLLAGVDRPSACWSHPRNQKIVCGTCYKMPFGDISATANIFKKAMTGWGGFGICGIEDNLSCIEFLQESGVLRGENVLTPWSQWASRRRNG